MFPTVITPGHTQAVMAAAKPAKEDALKPGRIRRGSWRSEAILKSTAQVIVGYGTVEAFVPQIKAVNVEMLNY